ncbi:unnamed protein product [Rhizoctonia solani]|uniref:Protein kinase domain-containing protein n=1 Tax=Rhizoctonia solani TaxID=456999 RepID=A0A8H3BPZ3_9AGAM|nr:unnamed protein product [Rhizoctonia solani]
MRQCRDRRINCISPSWAIAHYTLLAMFPEAPLAFLRHPMVTRSAAWLCRLPTNHPTVSRRFTTGSNTKPHKRNFRFSTDILPLDFPPGLIWDKPVTLCLQTRIEHELFGMHALDLYYCNLGTSIDLPRRDTMSRLNHTTPILCRVERHLQGARRAQSLPSPQKRNSLLEYIERPLQLWDTVAYGVEPLRHNATIMRLGETFAKIARATYTNIRDFNQAFKGVTIGLRGGIDTYHALREIRIADFQRRWIHSSSLVDEPATIEPRTIGSNMTITEITSILRRHCCKKLGHRLPLRAFSTHPVSTGGFGDIYLGKLENGTPVAIKVARYSANNKKQYKHTAKELHTWAKCQHPNILPLLGMVEFRDQIAMVSPWMKNGDLRNYLGQHPEADRCQLCYDICDGLVYLHNMSIVHGDLKGANVLISESGKALLSDFGNSLAENKTIRFTATTRDGACSSRWAAPEILEGATASYPADIYALGMVS